MTPEVAAKHSPERWWERGVFPECSCGYAPRDNGLLYKHWAEHGLSWYDNYGHLEWRVVLPDRSPETVERFLNT